MNQQFYRRVVLGQDGGFWAVFLRLLLCIAALFYSAGIRLRNIFYSKGWLKIYHSDVPVLSVGNITVGGTGKTPLVIRLCNEIIANHKCAILTRGYKTKKGKLSDEPAILTKSCPEAKVIVEADRVAGSSKAVSEFGAEVLIMDDGFQHRRLARDLDIVTIDATLPFGRGRMLPAGLLREPVGSLKRADAVVITRCDQADESELAQLEEKLRQVNPELTIARSMHAAVCIRTLSQNQMGIEELKDKKIFAFCGIGNPGAFLDTVKAAGLDLVGSRIYNDHHCYTGDCLSDIYEEARYLGADLILTTQKDWNKVILPTSAKKDIIFAYLAIELRFISGEDKLKQLIEEALAGKIPKG